MPKKVSVIFPTYNRPAYLKQTLDSILAQQGVDFEICLLDHGSGPATNELLQTYHDSRIREWRFEENRAPGMPCGFVFLGGKARGEYIILFSDDDRMLPGCLRKKVEILDAHPECGFVFSAVEVIDAKGIRRGKHDFNQPKQHDPFNATLFHELFTGNRICMPSGMFRREFMHHFEQSFGVLNDYAFWLELAAVTRSAFIPQSTIEYRIWDGSDSKINGAKEGEFLLNYPRIWKRWMRTGHQPSVAEYEKMTRNMIELAKQQIALIKEEFPPKLGGNQLLKMLQY